MVSLRKILKTPKKKTLTILIGIPGVGKSTLAKKMGAKDPKNKLVVSSDEIRFKLTKYEETGIAHDPKLEPKVWGIIKNEVYRCLQDSRIQECILDATNIKTAGRKKFIQMAREMNCKTRAIVLYAPLEDILTQNRLRQKKVSEEVINEFYFKFQNPKKHEFDKILCLGSRKKFERLKRKYEKKTEKKLKITGFDVMNVLGISSGKKVGDVLRFLEQAVKEKKIPNKRKALLQATVEKFNEEDLNNRE